MLLSHRLFFANFISVFEIHIAFKYYKYYSNVVGEYIHQSFYFQQIRRGRRLLSLSLFEF